MGAGSTSYLNDVNISGDITTTDSDIVFQDQAGTYPTSGKGFFWDLNTDEARIFAVQSQSDYIDLVFKVSDNTNNQNDRWVYWLDSYQGQSNDSFPLTMTADNAYFFCDPSSTDGKPNLSNYKVRIESDGDVDINGSLTKDSGTFRIPHPVTPDTHKLVHSFVEGPLCDLIYRGKAKLHDGEATININEYFGMMEGTFEALVDDTDVFITNNNSWDQVRGKIKGSDLTIECQNKKSRTTVSWLVIGDRKDERIKKAKWTDDDGKPILEPKNESPDILNPTPHK